MILNKKKKNHKTKSSHLQMNSPKKKKTFLRFTQVIFLISFTGFTWKVRRGCFVGSYKGNSTKIFFSNSQKYSPGVSIKKNFNIFGVISNISLTLTYLF